MKQQQKGFTIIEVVLVLAIAGLIFLMVFIALPALQKGQRDTQRRNDVSRFRAQVNQYQANNKGSVPAQDTTSVNSFLDKYLKDSGGWSDPTSGQPYTWVDPGTAGNNLAGLTQPGMWTYATGVKCNGESVVSAVGSRNYVVAMKLEVAGITCQDNQ